MNENKNKQKLNNRQLHHTTERILELMESISANPNRLTLSDLSNQLHIPKSTLSPILYTLTAKGYLTMSPDMKYTIGMKAYVIGNSFLQQFHFLDEAQKLLTSLTSICKETSHLAIRSGGNVLYLKKINSPEYIRMVSTVGNTLPAYGTALGKALLIDFTENELRKMYPNGLKPLTPNTITDTHRLYVQLQQAKKDGYTTENEESNRYIRCIGMPIYRGSRVIAAISVAVPTFRYSAEKESLIIAAMKETKHQMESLIDTMNVTEEDLAI